MNILVCGDAHLGLNIAGYDAHDDIVRAAEMIVDAADDADMLVLLGDLFHHHRPKPRDIAAAMQLLEGTSKPLIVIPGNHDAGRGWVMQEDGEDGIVSVPAPDALAPIRVMSLVQWHAIPEVPEVVEYGDHRFLLAGHVSDAKARHHAGCSAQELINHAFEEAIRQRVSAVFSHLDVDGATTGSEGAFLRGGRLQMPLDIAKQMPCPIVNGHIHHRQVIAPNIYLPGSIVPTDFGDIDGPKGYLTMEV